MCSLNKRNSNQTPPGNFLIVVTHFELILRTAQNPRIAVTSFMRKHIRDFIFNIPNTLPNSPAALRIFLIVQSLHKRKLFNARILAAFQFGDFYHG